MASTSAMELEHRKLLKSLATKQCALIDVRAPIEFAKGSLLGSYNIPILDDQQRQEVGLCYKQDGAEAATQLGHKLVAGIEKQNRVNAWRQQVENSIPPATNIMCWRGGQRSRIAQTWLMDVGCNIEKINGGYKALRQSCLNILDEVAEQKEWLIIGGRTGVKKTVLVHKLANTLDLEGRAKHRGSAFGGLLEEQPSQATFENHLAMDCLLHNSKYMLVEDESRTIGRVAIPEPWRDLMRSAPLVQIESTIDERAQHIAEEYVHDALAQGIAAQTLEERYSNALSRISRRLGGERHQRISALLSNAFAGSEDHMSWISTLLSEYYDPMYDYQLEKKQQRIQFTGTFAEVEEYLRNSYS